MKKIISALILLSFLAVPMAGLAVCTSHDGDPEACLEDAQGCYYNEESECVVGGAPKADIMETLNNIINWLFTILLVIAVIFMVLGGFQYIMAQGDADKVTKAGKYILYVLIGVIVALLARGLVSLVEKFMVT